MEWFRMQLQRYVINRQSYWISKNLYSNYRMYPSGEELRLESIDIQEAVQTKILLSFDCLSRSLRCVLCTNVALANIFFYL